MTTASQIQAAILEAQGLSVSASDMVLLLDRAIAAAIAPAGLGEVPVVSYSVGGRSRTLALSEAKELRRYYASIAGGSGGMIFMPLEFGREPNGGACR